MKVRTTELWRLGPCVQRRPDVIPIPRPLGGVGGHPDAGRRKTGRGGYVYLAVLFTSLIVVATVAATMSISTLSLRRETDRQGRMAALRHAESELHRIAAGMSASGLWRTAATSGVFGDWYAITVDGAEVPDGARFRSRFTDADGQLDDEDDDPVEVTVHVKVHGSEAAIVAMLEPDPKPYAFLNYSVTASDDLRFESSGYLACERPVQVTDDCQTSSSGLLATPRLECGGAIEIVLRGDLAGSDVVLPSRNVLDDYIGDGTRIPLASIPQPGGVLTLQDIVLSPTSNPLGAIDAAGIYWFDAGGAAVRIAHCRLDATLAIRNAAIIEVSGGIHWSYPLNAGAILVSDSNIRFRDVDAKLDETSRAVNFNPISSPFRLTLGNATTSDVYPTELRGVIYTSGDLRIDPLHDDAILRLTGCIVCRDLRIDGYVAVTQLDELINTPAPGLSDPTPMRFVRGTLRRIPSPSP